MYGRRSEAPFRWKIHVVHQKWAHTHREAVECKCKMFTLVQRPLEGKSRCVNKMRFLPQRSTVKAFFFVFFYKNLKLVGLKKNVYYFVNIQHFQKNKWMIP
jgi:hypothetical protein